jgi:hypothetical protein
MTVSWAERALWLATLLALVAGAFEAHRRSAQLLGVASPALLSVMAVVPARPAPDTLALAVGEIADRTLVRPERTSAEQHPSTQLTMPMAMPQPPSSKPHLVLRGVLGGPPWDAIIEGIPGHDGSVVMRAGQSLGGITVRAVRRDTAYARGFDTTWALPLARSWQ